MSAPVFAPKGCVLRNISMCAIYIQPLYFEDGVCAMPTIPPITPPTAALDATDPPIPAAPADWHLAIQCRNGVINLTIWRCFVGLLTWQTESQTQHFQSLLGSQLPSFQLERQLL